MPCNQNVEVVLKLSFEQNDEAKNIFTAFHNNVPNFGTFFDNYYITRKPENIKTRNSIQQEKIDFNTLFRYKKASTEKEEACQWDR